MEIFTLTCVGGLTAVFVIKCLIKIIASRIFHVLRQGYILRAILKLSLLSPSASPTERVSVNRMYVAPCWNLSCSKFFCSPSKGLSPALYILLFILKFYHSQIVETILLPNLCHFHQKQV